MLKVRSTTIGILVLAIAATASLGTWAAQPEVARATRGTDFGPVHQQPAPLDQAAGAGLQRGAESILAVAPSGAKVLLMMAECNGCSGGPLMSTLLSYGDVAAVDIFDFTWGLPSLAQLQAHDVVIVWTDCSPSDPVGAGNLLADYVDGGGKVILSVFSFSGADYWGISGRIMTANYTPLLPGEYNHYTWAELGTHDASSPLMQGVSAAGDLYRDYTTLTAGATLVASWTDGENFVATKGCVAGINLYPGCNYDFTGDVGVLYHNTVAWLYGGCAAFNKGFVDDYGRSEICYSSKTGAYKWNILSGAGASTSYTGAANILNGGVKIVSKPGDPLTLNVTYDPLKKKANGYFIGGGYYSALKDINTADDTPTCR
jgi:hypothetical protein